MDINDYKEELLSFLNKTEINQLIAQLRKELINDEYYLYVIRNIETDEYYIGSSYDIEKRFKSHMNPSLTALSQNKWYLTENFLDEDYEIVERKKIKNVNKSDIMFEETDLLLKYIESG